MAVALCSFIDYSDPVQFPTNSFRSFRHLEQQLESSLGIFMIRTWKYGFQNRGLSSTAEVMMFGLLFIMAVLWRISLHLKSCNSLFMFLFSSSSLLFFCQIWTSRDSYLCVVSSSSICTSSQFFRRVWYSSHSINSYMVQNVDFLLFTVVCDFWIFPFRTATVLLSLSRWSSICSGLVLVNWVHALRRQLQDLWTERSISLLSWFSCSTSQMYFLSYLERASASFMSLFRTPSKYCFSRLISLGLRSLLLEIVGEDITRDVASPISLNLLYFSRFCLSCFCARSLSSLTSFKLSEEVDNLLILCESIIITRMSYSSAQTENIKELLTRARLVTKGPQKPSALKKKPRAVESDFFITDCFRMEKEEEIQDIPFDYDILGDDYGEKEPEEPKVSDLEELRRMIKRTNKNLNQYGKQVVTLTSQAEEIKYRPYSTGFSYKPKGKEEMRGTKLNFRKK